MTNDDSARSPRPDGSEGDDAFRWPTGDESAAEVGRTVAQGLLAVLVSRIVFVQSLVWFLLGAGFLLGAWALWEEDLGRQETLAAFAGRAPGTIEAPFWRLDMDPDLLGTGTNWNGFSRREACARVRFAPEGGEEVTTTYCRRFPDGFETGSVFTWEKALGPVPVRWVDDTGMPRLEIRLSRRLARWLEQRGPEEDVFYRPQDSHGPESARRADRLLASLWQDLDDPFLRLLEEWSKPPPAVPVAYAPDDPARAAPLALLREQYTVPGGSGAMPGWVLAAILGFIGTLSWAAGAYLATFQNRWATAVLVVAGLAAVPWASPFAGKTLSYVWSDADVALAFIQSEMLALPPELVLAEPARGSDSESEPLVWSLETSSYWRLLRWIELRPPAEAISDDAVLRHLADQVHRQAVALPDGELTELLAWAGTVQERGEGEELGLLFVDAALELEADEARSESVRRQAERLLWAVDRYRPSDNPHRGAVEERRRILARLPA